MNDEIKEILELHIKHEIDLLPKNQQKVLDYITNLQQENERLKDILNKIMSSDGETTTPILDLIKEKEGYKSRIEKAVEYINGTTFFGLRSGKTFMSKYLNELLNILNGRSDE